MPVCNLYLLATPTSSTTTLLNTLVSKLSARPLLVAQCLRWMIRPTELGVNPLITVQPPWKLLIILQGTNTIPDSILRDTSVINNHYHLQIGVPSAVIQAFHTGNQRLLHPQSGDVPKLTGALDDPLVANSGQNLEYTTDLQQWMTSSEAPKGAVSMLNLLAFNPGKHDEYAVYGKAFGENIGKRRGGRAKVVGRVLGGQGQKDGWEEVAVAHYPSIQHFADMAASKDYQAVNQKYRVPALKDTCILCTSELLMQWPEGNTSSKL